MDKEDLNEIAELFKSVVDTRLGQIRDEITESNQQLRDEITEGNQQLRDEITEGNQQLRDEITEDNQRLRDEITGDNRRLREKLKEEFRHQLGVQGENFQHKLDLVVEGQQLLAEKLEATRAEVKTDIAKVDQRLTAVDVRLGQKIDSVASDLAAHRKDTEAHKGYRVCED